MALRDGALEVGSLEEAANAAEKAQRLLIKHNLSMLDIEVKEDKPFDKEEHLASDFKYNPREGTWIKSLLSGIAVNNLCKVITMTMRGEVYSFQIIGSPENIELVTWLGSSLVAQARQLEKSNWKSYQGYEKRGTFRRGFFQGFQVAIYSRLQETHRTMAEENQKVTALVVQNTEALERFVKEEFTGLKYKKPSRGTSSNDGFSNGYREGKQAPMNQSLKN